MYATLIALHLISACVWVGGALFLGGIALPAARQISHDDIRRRVIREVARRFRTIGWLALAMLIGTGLILAQRWGLTWSNAVDLSFFTAEGRFRAQLLGIKLGVVAALLVCSFIHDWVIGPKTGRAEAGTERHRRLKFWSAILGSATAILSLITVALACWMVRPWAL